MACEGQNDVNQTSDEKTALSHTFLGKYKNVARFSQFLSAAAAETPPSLLLGRIRMDDGFHIL